MTEMNQLAKRVKDLEQELEHERNLNAEIKARFVKCNTCTPDMKEKCLMFNENLCEGERCEELVDLMALVNKRDTDDKLDKAKDIIRQFLNDYPVITKEVLDKLEQFIKEE